MTLKINKQREVKENLAFYPQPFEVQNLFLISWIFKHGPFHTIPRDHLAPKFPSLASAWFQMLFERERLAKKKGEQGTQVCQAGSAD